MESFIVDQAAQRRHFVSEIGAKGTRSRLCFFFTLAILTTHVCNGVKLRMRSSVNIKILNVFMFYKIQHQLVNITFPPHFQHASSSIRRNNSLCYQQPNSNVDVYVYSFYPRTIRIWNRLPEAVECAPSVCAFKPIALNAISAMSPPASLRTL